MVIYNCHVHLFTIQHVPRKFLAFGLSFFLQIPILKVFSRFFLNWIIPYSNQDILQRFSNFIQITHQKTQQDIFRKVRSYYPLNTKFVVLPMDMAFMSAGKVPVDIISQHQELEKVRSQFPKQIIPFVSIDPRRENAVELVHNFIEKWDFKGFKIYPALGYYPDHSNLYQIYDYLQEKNLPLISHCSKGGVRNKKLSKKDCELFSQPKNYHKILSKFPNLRICLSHFGGDEEWDKYLNCPWDEDAPDDNKSWLSQILDMIRSGKYPNLYTDISYTIFSNDERIDILKIFLDESKIRDRVLFGSDFYMCEQEKYSERRMSLILRSKLGSGLFHKIAEINPKKFLN